MRPSMSDEQRVTVAIEPLIILTITTRLTRVVSGTPLGERMIFDVIEGSFEGPQLAGRVPHSGGDWVIRTMSGSQMDVRLLMETHDGASILFRYTGRASVRDGAPHLEISGSFEAPQGHYGWLNDIQAFGLGVVDADTVRYELFRFK